MIICTISEWSGHCVIFVSSQLFVMAYQAGTPEELTALVNDISTNIQKITLLSNTTHTHTHTNMHFVDSSLQIMV